MKKNYFKPAMEIVSVQATRTLLITSVPIDDKPSNNVGVKEKNSWDVFGGSEE